MFEHETFRYNEGKEVKAGGRYRFLYEDEESVALMIKKVEQSDGGKYTVKAVNEHGEVTTEGNLIIRGGFRSFVSLSISYSVLKHVEKYSNDFMLQLPHVSKKEPQIWLA